MLSSITSSDYSWDTMCSDSSYGDPSSVWYYPNYDESTCYSKSFSEYSSGAEKYPTKNNCCMEKFSSEVVSCCHGGEGECVSSGYPIYIPNESTQSCQARDSSLVSESESGSVTNTIEECCDKRK